MKMITSKSAKNGATLWYVDGRRTSRDKAVETDIENGRETLSKLTAGLRADPAVDNDFGIVVEMNDILGGRYTEYFYFATAEEAVEAARKIVAMGSEQIARVVIDNGRPYPANVRYADTVDGKLIFLNGFERFDETDEIKADEPQTETVKFEVGKTYVNVRKSVLFGSQFTITVIKRSDKFVTFQFDEDEEDIRRRKVVDEYGVEKIYIHETNALDGDYEFSANDVVDEAEAAEAEKVTDDEAAEKDTLKAATFDGEKHTAGTQTMSEIDEANWRYWEARGHKHRWLLGTGKYGETTVYFEQDGERYYAQEESEWQREAAEQLSMVYDEWEVRWYDEDEVPEADECYGWREVEADYYRDVL